MNTTKTLAKLAFPALLASAGFLTLQASADSTTPQYPGLAIGGKLPHTINLADLEARSLERFADLDSDSNGLIDSKEFAASVEQRSGRKGRHHRGDSGRGAHDGDRRHRGHHKHTQEEKDALKAELFSRLDTDKNGELSSEEFADRRDVRKTLRYEQYRQFRFDHLDQNSDQQISLQEFQLRLEKMRALDSDTDGIVTRAELRSGIKERRANKANSE